MRSFPGWWQVGVALLVQAASSASVFTAYSVIAAPLQQTFEPSRMMLMMGITLAAMAAGVLGAPIGSLVDRFSISKLMLLGTGLLATGFMLISFTTSMPQVLAIYFLVLSVGAVLTGPVACSALVARWFTRRRGLAMSIAASGGAVGGLLIPPLLQFLIDTFEWRAGLQVFSVILLVTTAPVVALLAIDRPAKRNLFPDGDSEPPVVTGQMHQKATSMAFFLRDPNFWLIGITLGIMFAGPMALMSNLIPFVLEKNIDAAKGAALLSIYSGANFAGKLCCGAIADRVDFRAMLAVILMVIALGMFGYLQADTFTLLTVVSLAVGLASGAIVPLWSIMLARIYGPDNMGRSMGLMGFFIMPFTLTAPPLFGRIFDMTGSYDNGLIGVSILALCAIALVSQLRVHRSPAPAAAG